MARGDEAPARRPALGILGVEALGAGLVARLVARGHAVSVHDADPRREADAVAQGAMACRTAAGLAASSDVLISTLPTQEATQAALFGPHGATDLLPAGAAVMFTVALAPAVVDPMFEALRLRGFDVLDAPLAGGSERAHDGQLHLLLACPREVMARHRALLETLATRVWLVGEKPGDATRMRLVETLLAGINLAGAAEALALAERLGLAPTVALDVLEQSSAQSWIGNDRLRRAVRGDYMPRLPIAHTRDDVARALAMARAADADTPLGEQAAQLFAMACERGLGALDDAAVLELLRRR